MLYISIKLIFIYILVIYPFADKLYYISLHCLNVKGNNKQPLYTGFLTYVSRKEIEFS